MDTCNAVEKDKSKVLVCEKPLGHAKTGDEEHQDGEKTWKDRGGW